MKDEQVAGIVFPATAEGRRSTAALGRSVVAAALRSVDPAGARAAEQETAWRTGYVVHFRRLLEAGLTSPESWLDIATAGLDAVHEQLRIVLADGTEAPLTAASTEKAVRVLQTAEVRGSAEPGEFVLPYRGRELRGDDLREQVNGWVEAGVVEPSVGTAIDAVLAHPEWLRLDGRTVVVLGAGAEMGPLPALLGWGATVAAVDVPRAAIWERILQSARRGAGRLLVPVSAAGSEDPAVPDRAVPDGVVLDRAGVDLVTEMPAIADWLTGLPGTLVLGNYVYADGGTHVRVAAAVDALTRRLQQDRDDLALAFLATPTDVFAVPGEAVRYATDAYQRRSTTPSCSAGRCAR